MPPNYFPLKKVILCEQPTLHRNHTAIFAGCCSFWRTLKNAGSSTGSLKPLLSERTLSSDDDDGDDDDDYNDYYDYY